MNLILSLRLGPSGLAIWVMLCTLGCSRSHEEVETDFPMRMAQCPDDADTGDACEEDWECIQQIEGSTGTHDWRLYCVDGIVVAERWFESPTSDGGNSPDGFDGGPGIHDATVMLDATDAADADADAGEPSICDQICENAGCGVPFGDADCLNQCEERARSCTGEELASLEACVGLCDSLYPCVAAVGCLFAPRPRIPCGDDSCVAGRELCVGCSGEEGSRRRAYCAARHDEDFFRALSEVYRTLPDGCTWAGVVIECRTHSDCDPGEVCYVTAGEGGYASCRPPEEVSMAACESAADCSPEYPECREYDDPFGYFVPFRDVIGWVPTTCQATE